MVGWYKRDPSAALEGMQQLTLEERGAYNTVIDLIYVRDDRLYDDDRFISGHLGVDMRVWKRIKASLLTKGKLAIEAGFIRNKRASTEVHRVVATSVANRVAGQHSGIIRAEKAKAVANENNDLNGTPVGTLAERPLQPSKTKIKIKKETPPIVPPFQVPEWVPKAEWDGWIEMRKKMGKAPTERAMMLAIRNMEEAMKRGNDPGKMLDLATLNNWKGVFPGRDGSTLAKGQVSFGI